MAKDLFSNQSGDYARYRPVYPQELFDYLLSHVQQRQKAWDCATGNGQAARVLADYFEEVEATDISAAQLEKAVQKPNIRYQVCPAEQTPFDDSSFDLITVATAYHWIDAKKFKQEVHRVAKAGAVLAVWAYSRVQSEDEAIGRLTEHFYNGIVFSYWDPERRHVDEGYANIEFDYPSLPPRNFEVKLQWTRKELVGYLATWSAVQNYIKANGSSPIDLIQADLERLWPKASETKNFTFPVFVRAGRIEK